MSLLPRRARLFCATLCVALGVLLTCPASMAQGFSVGNFGIAAEASREGRLFSRILVNPAKLGPWLEDLGATELRVTANGASHSDDSLQWQRVDDVFPRFRARSSDSKLSGIEVEIDAFSPLAVAEGASENFLPLIFIEARLTNHSARPVTASAMLELRTPEGDISQVLHDSVSSSHGPIRVTSIGRAFVAGLARDQRAQLLAPGKTRVLQFVVGAFESEGHYANQYPSRTSLIQGAFENREALRARHSETVELLPRLGDPLLDRALRSYVSAAILLTRGLRDGKVLTMGYCELNQRDSYWTSWIHLFFWPDLDRRMIRESIAGQLPSGKIPTTILPFIDRADDIDITAYFVLRVLRHFKWHRDRAFLAEAWPAVRRAISYLRSLDSENSGLPRQHSYWADWKDIPGIEGRAYAPHFDWLYIAALTEASRAAGVLGEEADAEAFGHASARALERIELSTQQGGLWNGHYYVETFTDGKVGTSLLQDQVVGIFFGSMSKDRASSVLDSLRANETSWGVRETFPYREGAFDQPHGGPGNYHNGGVWPWLNFVDATGRYLQGRGRDAERIVRAVALADLGDATSGDRTPNEFMNGDSGQNLGEPIQGWNGSIFATAYVGAFGLDRVSDATLRISPNLPERDFDSWLVLPGGRAHLFRSQGKLGIESNDHLPYSIQLGQE